MSCLTRPLRANHVGSLSLMVNAETGQAQVAPSLPMSGVPTVPTDPNPVPKEGPWNQMTSPLAAC